MPTQLLAPAKQRARLTTDFPRDRRCHRTGLHRRRNDALLLGSRPPSAPPNRTDDIDLRLCHRIAPISIFIKSRPLPPIYVDKLGHLPPPDREVSQGLNIRSRSSSILFNPATLPRELAEESTRDRGEVCFARLHVLVQSTRRMVSLKA